MIDDLNLDGLVEPVSTAPVSHLPELLSFIQNEGLTPGSTTGGRHNLGSKHYTGNAVDIKGSGLFSNAQVNTLRQRAAAQGFLVRDERVRPANQKVWGGPHVHIEYTGNLTQPSDNLNLDGLVEPLNVQGLVEPSNVAANSIVPPVPQAPTTLTSNDAAWHFGMTPDEMKPLSRRAMDVLQKAVVEDQRKKSLGQEIQQPSIQYQNEMRKQAGLPLIPLARRYYNGSDAQGKPLGGNPLMPVDRTMPQGKSTDAELMEQAVNNVSGFMVSPTANVKSAYRAATRGLEGGFEADVQEEYQRLKDAQARANTPEMIAARKRIGTIPSEGLYGSPGARGFASAFQRFGGETLKAAGGAIDIQGLITGLGGVIPGVRSLTTPIRDWANQRGDVLIDSASMPLNEQGKAIERALPEKATDAVTSLGLSVVQLILLKRATGLNLGPLMALEATLKNSDKPASQRAVDAAEAYGMGKILDQHLSRPMTAVLFGSPTGVESAEKYAKGNMKLEDALLQTGVQAGAGAILGGKKGDSIVPEVPREVRIEDMPDIPVSTISEPRVIKKEGQINATEKGIITESSEPEYQGTQGVGTPAEASSRNRTVESGQIEQEGQVVPEVPFEQEARNAQGLNLSGLVEPAKQTPQTPSVSAQETPASPSEPVPFNWHTRNRDGEWAIVDPNGKEVSRVANQQTAEQIVDELRNQPDAKGMSLSQAVRAAGGIRYDKDMANQGELSRLSNKETQSSGLVNNKSGSSLESMAEEMANEGYGLGDWAEQGARLGGEGKYKARYEVNMSRFLEAVEEDQSGSRKHYSTADQMDSEFEYRRGLQTQQDEHDADQIVTLLENEGTGELYDDIVSGKATQEEVGRFRAEAYNLGISPEATDKLIASARAGGISEDVGLPESSTNQTEDSSIIPPVPQFDRVTGIKHAVVEAERELQGLPQFEKARRAHGASFDEGVFDVQSGRIKPRELASDIVRAFYDPKFSMERFQSRRPRPLSTEESMALLYDRMRIATEQKAAEAEFEAANQSGDEARIVKAVDEVSRLQQASNANDEADYVAGGEQGRGLAIRREMIKDDYSRARVLSQAVARNKGKPLPVEVQAKLESVVEELAKAHARIADLESQQSQTIAESEVNKIIRQQRQELRTRGRQRTRQIIATERADIKQQIAAEYARLKAQRQSGTGIQPSVLAGLDPEGRITKLVGQLARGYVEEGVTKAADLVDAVHDYIKDVADLTRREVQDLISGYGKTSQPKPDEISKKLTEIRALLRVVSGKADVIEKGVRPLRSGFQRPKPSQELREAIRDLRETLRTHGIEIEKSVRSAEDQQKSILDAAKTTTRNRIEDLTKWIADGKRTVTGKTEIIPDAELRSLRTERDRLQTVFDAIKDPEADQKAITRALGATNKSILSLESKIKTGNIAPKTKAAQPSSPELEAAHVAQKTLQGILRDMRTAEKRANKPAEDPDVADARRVLAAQKAFMTRNRQRMVAMQGELALAQRGVKAEKAQRKPVPLTDEMKVAQHNANQLRRNIDDIYAVIDWANKTNLQKGLAYGAAGVRAGVLSGLKVLGKIGGALLQRIPQQYLEELAGKGWAQVFPEVAAKAPRHGAGSNAVTEAAFLRGLKEGVLEIPSIIKTGESELSLEHGTRYPNIPTRIGTALAIPGRLHMAEKNPLKVGEYNRSLEANLQWAERQGMERTDPDVIEQAKKRAYKDAEEIVLLGDNPFSRFLRNGRRSMSDEGRGLTRIVVPVERVPSNYLSQAIGDYGFGLVRGAIRALKARNPELLEKMTPEEADKTMRLLKRGSLGLVYTALASSGVVGFGGYWSQRKKGERRDIAPNDVKIGPVTVSHMWVHSPPVELAQFAATIKREIQSRSKKRESVAKKALTGVAHGAKGLADQTPFLNQYTRIYDSFQSGDALEKKLGETLAGWVEPQIVKELAAATDREDKGKHTIIPWKGEAVQRKVKTFGDAMLAGLPIGRERLKIDRKKMLQQRQDERRSIVPPVPQAQGLNLRGLIEPSPSP